MIARKVRGCSDREQNRFEQGMELACVRLPGAHISNTSLVSNSDTLKDDNELSLNRQYRVDLR